MSDSGDNEGSSTANLAGDEKSESKKKLIRLLTVMAYVSSVSGSAFMLSLYYIFLWEPKVAEHHLKADPNSHQAMALGLGPPIREPWPVPPRDAHAHSYPAPYPYPYRPASGAPAPPVLHPSGYPQEAYQQVQVPVPGKGSTVPQYPFWVHVSPGMQPPLPRSLNLVRDSTVAASTSRALLPTMTPVLDAVSLKALLFPSASASDGLAVPFPGSATTTSSPKTDPQTTTRMTDRPSPPQPSPPRPPAPPRPPSRTERRNVSDDAEVGATASNSPAEYVGVALAPSASTSPNTMTSGTMPSATSTTTTTPTKRGSNPLLPNKGVATLSATSTTAPSGDQATPTASRALLGLATLMARGI